MFAGKISPPQVARLPGVTPAHRAAHRDGNEVTTWIKRTWPA
ncbi:hypothetical protein ABT340_10475 [Streptosporangium sp. NPDC000239]